jgi:nitrile hydratase accessory protein
MPSQSDKTFAGLNVAELRIAMPELPCDDDAALVFNAPWEAHAFAMTLALHERGMFTWSEWAEYLNLAIRHAQASGDPDLGDTFYAHWLTALEHISTAKGLVAGEKLLQRRADWDLAARRTPHGQPIELRRKRP